MNILIGVWVSKAPEFQNVLLLKFKPFHVFLRVCFKLVKHFLPEPAPTGSRDKET